MKITVILLAGARYLTEPGIVPGTLADIAFNIAEGPVVIRHGACPGENSADQTASDWINSIGNRYGITEDPMPAYWDNCTTSCPPGHRRRKKPGDTAHPGLLDDYCPAAGPRRNGAMVAKLPHPEWMVAFPEPGQPNYGTRGCMRLAKQAGIKVYEITA
ncbi:hypothetical protein [Streptomyces nigrescens]|uniref:Uncharacterized protein n=1 Tax=Streptomyces nigrescens TaxID=1920 RepID=A0A640TAD0_STRNI|nr:hypothetical protein [Streptomyces libani]WAT94972.1 hypothetical protein STRLI_000645 [Streptomyces libani subsp. libani]GFE20130.1 hypothetical protein Sliba_05830 [Streptomyces libani subsp. libani]GGV85952.1 hypothetical protein GCM10010500_03270 [Streptomyces libani subsp. libani]